MKKKKKILILILGLGLISFLKFIFFSGIKVKFNTVVAIQPYEKFDTILLYKTTNELRKVFKNIVVLPERRLPSQAYYKLHNRFRAPNLLQDLSSISGKDTPIIGMSEKDISHSTNSVFDYGILGLGYCPRNASVVSTFRLKKNNLTDQFIKLCKHELGHTFGLPHCENNKCLMQDAEGVNKFKELDNFCISCKKKLLISGWHL